VATGLVVTGLVVTGLVETGLVATGFVIACLLASALVAADLVNSGCCSATSICGTAGFCWLLETVALFCEVAIGCCSEALIGFIVLISLTKDCSSGRAGVATGWPGELIPDSTGGLTRDLAGGLTGSLTRDLAGGLTGSLARDLAGGLTGDLARGLAKGLFESLGPGRNSGRVVERESVGELAWVGELADAGRGIGIGVYEVKPAASLSAEPWAQAFCRAGCRQSETDINDKAENILSVLVDGLKWPH